MRGRLRKGDQQRPFTLQLRQLLSLLRHCSGEGGLYRLSCRVEIIENNHHSNIQINWISFSTSLSVHFGRVKRKSVVLEEPEGMVNDRTWGINQKINLGGSGNVRFAAVAATDAQAAEREGEIEGNSNILSDEGTDIGAAQKTSSAAIQAESNAAPAETTQNNVASEGAAPSADMSTLNPLKRSKPVPVHVSPLMRAAGVPRFPGKIAGVPVADEW